MVSKRHFNNPSKSVKNIKLNSISCFYCMEMCPQEAIKLKLRGLGGFFIVTKLLLTIKISVIF